LGVVHVIEGAISVVIHAANAKFIEAYDASPLADITPYPRVEKLFSEQCLMHS
jgi:serine protease inhibitor ecotin